MTDILMKKIIVFGIILLLVIFTAQYGQAQEVENSDEAPTLAKGIIYWFMDEDYEKTIEEMTRLIELKPEYGSAYHLRALAYYELGEYDKAWDDVHRSREAAEPAEEDVDLVNNLKAATGRAS